MPLAEDMKNIVEGIISSYEARVQSIGAILNTTGQLLEGFQESLLDAREEREKVKAELRENLARNESLRKKDFDNMMHDILSAQEQREKQVRSLLKDYLNEQKEMAKALGNNLDKVRDAIAKGEARRVKELQTAITKILEKQEQRKQEVSSELKEFQRNRQEMGKRLRELLAKGRELRTKDLKSMLTKFKREHKERTACRQERKEAVQKILGSFKGERLEAAQSWRAMQKKMAQRRPVLPAAVNMGV